jgi:hypothetical protein
VSREKPRPIRRSVVKRVNPYRIPEEGPLTPRLRPPTSSVGAIGFHHSFKEQEDDHED